MKPEMDITFMSGELIAVGGKHPNIHVSQMIRNKSVRIIIDCKKSDAFKANKYLYKNIEISVFVKTTAGKKQHTFCDVYENPETLADFKTFLKEFDEMEEVPSLVFLHEKMKEYVDMQRFSTLRKFIRLFNHEETDINVLKTILVFTKSFKEHETLKHIRQEVMEKYDKQFAQLKDN